MPSLNVTVPLGVPVTLIDKVAVSVTDWPNRDGSGDDINVVCVDAVCTVKACKLLVPAAVVTETSYSPAPAEEAMLKVAIKVVEFETLTAVVVTPEPLTDTVVPPGTKLVPFRITWKKVPIEPLV